MNLEIGQTIGEYEIVEELGGGGHGRVYKVEHTITKRIEAVKVLAGGAPPTDEQRRRFQREIQVHARLGHPNIAAVHNAFWVDDNLVMVMEYLDGCPLQRLLEEGRVRPEDGVAYLRQVLAALAHAHAQGVVHRDVSPANIVVGPGGRVKLTDFGLAKGLMDAPITTTGALVGSLCYISPEQVRGTQIPDARSDIYSCGVVLYETSTGRKPFASACAFTLMRAHVELAPVPPSVVNPGLPPMLNDVILRALAKDPADRFQTADDFSSALEGIAVPHTVSFALAPATSEVPVKPVAVPAPPVIAAGPSPWGQFLRSMRSQAVGVLLGASFMTAVLGAVFWTGEIPRIAPIAPAKVTASTSQPAAPSPAPPSRFVLPPAAAPETPPAALEPEEEATPPRAERRDVPAPAPRVRRKSFHPPESRQPHREIALAEPPPLPPLPLDPAGSDAVGRVWSQPVPEAPADTAAEPPPNQGRFRRLLDKVRLLNPFRQRPPAPSGEK